jgi:hypothetical protein
MYVVEAYGNVLAVDDVAVKYEDLRKLSNDPIPATARDTNGDEVPIPTLPLALIMKRVEVAVPAVVEPMANSEYGLDDDAAYSDSSAYGVDVPIPTKPANVDVAVVDVAIIALTVGVLVAESDPDPVQYAMELEKPEPVRDEPPTHIPLIA